MTLSRRTFLQTSLAAAATSSLAAQALAGARRASAPRPGDTRTILILGGTGFLGPAVVEAAKAAGHTLTLFNRGQTEKRKGGNMFPGVEQIHGDRKKDLELLKDRKWDAVVDTSGYYPRDIKAATDILAPNIGHYVFISSISVYKDNSKPNADETAELATTETPEATDMGPQMANYGPLKALCEQAAEKAMPGKTTNIRPGFIVGPNDPTDRFTYWPVRIQKGGEVIAPGTKDDPLQVIDVRDLGAWIVRVIENRTFGEFNATGGEKPHAFGDVLETCKKVSKSDAEFVWITADELKAVEVEADGGFPLWIPPTGETAGFHRVSVERARKAGLKFRPLAETIADTLKWWPVELERRARVTKEMTEQAVKDGKEPPKMADPKLLRTGVSMDKEAEIIKAWRTAKK